MTSIPDLSDEHKEKRGPRITLLENGRLSDVLTALRGSAADDDPDHLYHILCQPACQPEQARQSGRSHNGDYHTRDGNALTNATSSHACTQAINLKAGALTTSEGHHEFAEHGEQLAERYLKAGLSIIPVTEGKRPSISSWKGYQKQPATCAEIRRWLENPLTLGFAVICGAVSGQLEVIDIDDARARDEVLKQMSETAPELLARLLIVDIPMTNGTVVIMPWTTNSAWTHEVPRSTRYQGRRISVTVRAFRD